MNERCQNVVGPVWKLDGESWACELPAGHDAEHEAGDTWWAPDVGNVLASPSDSKET